MYAPDQSYIVLDPSEEEQWVKEGRAHALKILERNANRVPDGIIHAIEVLEKHTSSKSGDLSEERQRLRFGTDGIMVYPVITQE